MNTAIVGLVGMLAGALIANWLAIGRDARTRLHLFLGRLSEWDTALRRSNPRDLYEPNYKSGVAVFTNLAGQIMADLPTARRAPLKNAREELEAFTRRDVAGISDAPNAEFRAVQHRMLAAIEKCASAVKK